MERGRPRSRDGDLLCPAQFSGAPEPLVTYDLIGINSIEEARSRLTEGLAASDAIIAAFFVTVDFNSTSPGFPKIRAIQIDAELLIGFHRLPFS